MAGPRRNPWLPGWASARATSSRAARCSPGKYGPAPTAPRSPYGWRPGACITAPSALGAFLRRLKARLGTPKAVVATAHKLARLVYRLLKHGEAYVTHGMAAYEQTYRERVVQSLARKAKALGYKLLPTTDDALQASSA